jgi:putative acetyltransferase
LRARLATKDLGFKLMPAFRRRREAGINLTPMTIRTHIDDLTSAPVRRLIAEHLAAMEGDSPPGQVNALGLAGLQAPDVTVWSA